MHIELFGHGFDVAALCWQQAANNKPGLFYKRKWRVATFFNEVVSDDVALEGVCGFNWEVELFRGEHQRIAVLIKQYWTAEMTLINFCVQDSVVSE